VADTKEIKLVSLVQPNFQTGPSRLNVYHLPYSVGCVWSYAYTHPTISSSYRLDHIIWRRDPVDDVAKKLAENAIVIFSAYIWNRKYNYVLAKKIKKLNPSVVTIFGGPEVPVSDPAIFEKHPYIDYVVKKEGEITFLSLLLHINDSAQPVPTGILINQHGQLIDTGEGERILDLSQLPSPYGSGIFDKIVNDNPQVAWTATIESNRGCPYQCTFCDWGGLTYSKVRHFPIERVFKDIEWVGKNCDGMWMADANFGMFVDRDRAIIDKLIETHRKGPGPNYFYTNWAKNQKSEVVELISKLSSESTLISNGLTVSVQSMTPEVLDIIKRTNLKQHKIKEIFDLAEKSNLQVYTELILGLPGETVESFMNTVYEVMEAGNHHGVDIFQCQLLENAELNRVQSEIYNIKTKDWVDYISPRQDINDQSDYELIESIAVTTETSTLPKEKMLYIMAWTAFMGLFHFYGFSTQLSRFLRKYINESYQDFYKKLYHSYCQDSYFSHIHKDQVENYRSLIEHGKILNPMVTAVPFNGVKVGSGVLMRTHIDNRVEYTFEFLEKFIKENYNLPADLVDQLLDYQQQTLFTHKKSHKSYESVVTYDYNFYDYLASDAALDSKVTLKFSTKNIQHNLELEDFVESLYFRKKQAIGLLKINSLKDNV
jgi:radical SAM superfamily enzyme YgiQ (UPF0313 family)